MSQIRGALVAACLALAVAGCGERDFDAPTLVEELNSAGAELELGEPLSSSEEGSDVYALRFAHEDEAGNGHEEEDEEEAGHGDEAGNETTEDDHGHEHGGGALVILDGTDEARAEFERCRSAISLTCFRAANAVLRFEGLEPDEQARLEQALVEVSNGG